jgi:hypothetical protein
MTDHPEPPSDRVSGPSQPMEDQATIAPSSGRVGDVAVVQHFLRLGIDSVDDSSAGSAASFLRWIVATTSPDVTVSLGDQDSSVQRAVRDAVAHTGVRARYIAVGTADRRGGGSEATPDAPFAGTSSSAHFEDFDSEEDARDALGADAHIDLLHVAVAEGGATAFDVVPWLQRLGPGSTVVFTGPPGAPEALDRIATDVIPHHLRTLRVALGPGGEALVAQEPTDGSSGSVDLLEDVPVAVGSMVNLFGNHRNARHQGGELLELSSGTEALVDGLIERHELERAAFLDALRTYQDLTLQLTEEVSAARQALAVHIESSRLERETLVQEFLDRVDLLVAKVSTGASKHASEITLKERQLEDAENRVLAYAGLAASAESVVEDLRRSSSWRVTAPLRLFSSVMRRARSR